MAMFRNSQWAVTDDGMESVGDAPEYVFEASRLSETTHRPKGVFYDWPVHMAEKTWVDVPAFNEAFSAAMAAHAGRYEPPLDKAMLRRSLAEASRIAAEER